MVGSKVQTDYSDVGIEAGRLPIQRCISRQTERERERETDRQTDG